MQYRTSEDFCKHVWLCLVLMVVACRSTPPPPPTPTPPPLPASHIVFVSDRDGDNEIFLMASDGSIQVNLSRHPADDSYPSWFPDGRRILFLSERGGVPQLYLIEFGYAQSVRPYDLVKWPPSGAAPSISPDGTWIVYTASSARGEQEIFKVRIDGSEVIQLTNSEGHVSSPIWSPNGRHIAFQSNMDRTKNMNIYTIKADGSDLKKITNFSNDEMGASSQQLAWRPDGRWLVYRSSITGMWDLHLHNLYTGEDKLVREIEDSNEFWPAWSPDGRWIAFSLNSMMVDDSDAEVCLIQPDGQNLRCLTKNEHNDMHPQWRPTQPEMRVLVCIEEGCL